MIPLQFSFDH